VTVTDPDLDLNYGPLLPTDRTARILDVGCGDGRLIQYLVDAGFKDVLGVDIDAASVAAVERRHPGSALHIGNLEEFCAGRRASFDVVIAKQVIYYFSAVVPVLESLRAVLVPGGTLVAEVFNGSSMTGPYVKHKDHEIQCVFTETSLQRALLDAGYAEVRVLAGRLAGGGLRRRVYRGANAAWGAALRAVYVLERGADPGNPRIVSKNLLATGRQGAR
jgi:SAM-dependent methyltransferase